MKIGLIGFGIIGNAFYENMKHMFDIVIYDKKQDDCRFVKNIKELVFIVKKRPIFVSVPTPMNEDGSCHIDIVDSVCQEINEAVNHEGFAENDTISKQIVVIRSTIIPGTTYELNNKYKNLNVVFNPEFLTENNAILDFKRQNRIIIGGDPDATKIVASLYHIVFPYVKILECSSRVAELTKYTTNAFLATKVSFANEIFQICEKLNINYEELISLVTLDQRLGTSHWKVTKEKGFSGKCLPKDLNALIAKSYDLGIDPILMEAVNKKNLEVRNSNGI